MTNTEVQNTLPLDEFGNVFLGLYNCAISVSDFINRFNGASLTYSSLYNHANATNAWKNQIDDWKGKGIIS